MASTCFNLLHRVFPFSALLNGSENDLKVSNSLVNKLQIPDYTKQFVFAIQDTNTKAVVYILYVHGLSEKSAADTKYLIKAVQPDAVISDWSWADNIAHDFGDSPNEPIPTSVFAVVKRFFLYKTNKHRYQNVAVNCFVREIFGVGYETHHLVAQKTAEEIGSSFLMGSPRYFKVKPVEVEKEVEVMYKVPTFAENVYGYIENGGKVDHKDLARLYRFQSIVEDRRLMNYREGNRTNACKTVGSNVLKFSDLSVEVKSQYLIAQGIRAQTEKFKKIVVITGQDDWYGIRHFWNAPRFQEIEDIKRQLYVSREDSGLEFPSSEGNSRVERRPVSLAAGGAASLAVSVLLGEKMRPVCNFIRKEKTGIAPWLACAGFAIWLQYGDAVTSLPAAPAIARLGRGIQSLQQASKTIRHLQETRINEHKINKIKLT